MYKSQKVWGIGILLVTQMNWHQDLKALVRLKVSEVLFRPHLQCGDEAIITNQNGIEESLGVITEIDQKFGFEDFIQILQLTVVELLGRDVYLTILLK